MSSADATTPASDPLAAGDAGAKVIRGGGLRTIGHALGMLAGLVSAPLVVQHLGIEDFGRYLTVTSVIYIVTGLTEGGLNSVAVRGYATADRAGQRSLVSNLVGLRVVLSLIGAAGAIGFGLLAGYPGVVIGGLALGGLSYVVSAVQGAFTIPLQAGLRLGTHAGIDLVRSLLTTALLITLVVAGTGLTPFFCVAAVVQGVALGLTVRAVRRDVPLAPSADRAVWGGLLRETAVYAAATALGVVYFQVALVSMSVLSTATETGYYSVAFRIVDLANGVPWLLAGSVLPVLAHAAVNDQVRMRYVTGRVFQGALLAGGLLSLVLIVGSRFGIDFLTGKEDAEPAIAVLRLLGVGIIATFLISSMGFVLLSLRLYRELILCNAAALVLALTLSIVLVPSEGALGAGIVTMVLELVLAASYVGVLTLRRPDLRPPLWVLPRVALAYGLGLAAGLAVLAVHPVPAVAAAVAVYLGVLAALRTIPPEIAAAARQRVHR
ncbi:MAG: polysaccharide biosynthesis protein [Solirubrobacterales bacterium]|nr:polysaccharide biosynthesis protein [Solirubrobacterales bacterium]